MIRTTRLTIVTLPTLIAVGWFTAVGCSSTNEPAVGMGGSSTGSGGTSGTGAGGSTGGTAGTTGGTGGVMGSGTTGGTGGTMGSGTTGGTGGVMGSGTTGGTGGVMGGGTGGAGGAGGSAASDGGTRTFSPVCASAVAKGEACTASDPQLCYKTCGPLSAGFKEERCTAGVWTEEQGGPPCYFPEGDYSCYKVPTTVSTTCPQTPPQASTDCTVAACTPCSANGMYLDSGGAAKVGHCVCPVAGASGSRKWSCASTQAWPCPGNPGCQ